MLHDEQALENLNRRFSAVEDWWWAHIGGPVNEDHVLAIALDYADLPVKELVSILNRTLHRAARKPFSLRYFKVALEEGRGAYFKSQDRPPVRTSGVAPVGELLPGLLERLGSPETAPGRSDGAPVSRRSPAPGRPS